MAIYYWVGGWTGNTGFNSGYSPTGGGPDGSGPLWTSVINGATSSSGDYGFGPYYWGFPQNWRTTIGTQTTSFRGYVLSLTGGPQGGQQFDPIQCPRGGDEVRFTIIPPLSSVPYPNDLAMRRQSVACLFGALTGSTSAVGPIGNVWLSGLGNAVTGASGAKSLTLVNIFPGSYGSPWTNITGSYRDGPAGFGIYARGLSSESDSISEMAHYFRRNQIGFDSGAGISAQVQLPIGFTSDREGRCPISLILGANPHGATGSPASFVCNSDFIKVIILNATSGSTITAPTLKVAPDATNQSRFGVGFDLDPSTLRNNKFAIGGTFGTVFFPAGESLKTISVGGNIASIDSLLSNYFHAMNQSVGEIEFDETSTIRGVVNIRPYTVKNKVSIHCNGSGGSPLTDVTFYSAACTASSYFNSSGSSVPISLTGGLIAQYGLTSNYEIGNRNGPFDTQSISLIKMIPANTTNSGLKFRMMAHNVDIQNHRQEGGCFSPSPEIVFDSSVIVHDGYLKDYSVLEMRNANNSLWQNFEVGPLASDDGLRVDSKNVEVYFPQYKNFRVVTTTPGIT